MLTIKSFNKTTSKLTPSPLCAIFAVFDGHAEFFQFIADLIRERPLFLLAGFIALGNEGIDLCFGIAGALLFLQTQTKDISEFTQCLLCSFKLRIGGTTITRGVDGFDEFVQRGYGKRRVEIIVHGVVEGLFGGICLDSERGSGVSGESAC